METTNIRVTQSGEIRLALPNQKPRNIGWFSENGDTFHCQRNPAKHLHYKSESYGFNFELLKDGSFVWVYIHLPFGGLLITSRNHILKNGSFLHFNKVGFEKQIFLSLSEFGIDRARETEKQLVKQNVKTTQQTLFGEVA
jgi:hypothetical protein